MMFRALFFMVAAEPFPLANVFEYLRIDVAVETEPNV